jgi:hypothetical protein
MKHFMRVCHKIWSCFKFQFTATTNFTYKQNMWKTFEWSKTWFKWFSFPWQKSMLKVKLFKLKFWPTIQSFKIKIWERYLKGNKKFHGLSFRKKTTKFLYTKIKMQMGSIILIYKNDWLQENNNMYIWVKHLFDQCWLESKKIMEVCNTICMSFWTLKWSTKCIILFYMMVFIQFKYSCMSIWYVIVINMQWLCNYS